MEQNNDIKIRRLHVDEISSSDDLINYKIIMVGNSGVGKTCVLMRAVNNRFTDKYQATIGFEFLLLYFQVNNVKIKLQIWDTCGQELYRSLIQGFYRNTSVTILVYSKTSRESYEDLNSWIKDIKMNTEEGTSIFLLGNKCDEEKNKITVSKEEGEQFAKQYNLNYFNEVSAKTGYHIVETFEEIAKTVYKNYCLKRNPRQKVPKMSLEQREDSDKDKVIKKKKCC